MRPPSQLTPLGELLLATVRQAGERWLTRNDIAQHIGRPRLTPYDLMTLEYLTEQGLIEVRQTKRGVVALRYEYRAKG
jgi:hypothetical protein